MSDISLPLIRTQCAWLRNPQFDLTFVLGIPTVAILTGLFVTWHPGLFAPILVFDLWFLGYHHVIATFTRLCFDRRSFAEHRALMVVVLPLVAIGTIALAYMLGLWVVVSIYFYWQWFHYARQSWGISRAYRAKQRDALYEDVWLDLAVFYAVPLCGILYRSHQDPGSFLGLELKVLPVSAVFVDIVAAATVALLAVWIFRRARAWHEGRLATVHTLYMLTHFAIFFTAYLAIRDITFGWLVINMWHNAQYILFVWMFNTRRFKDGIDPNARLLSYISQPDRLGLYLITCILVTGIIYWGAIRTLDWLFFAGLSATIVLYQIVNFHHYIVDARIWKIRTAPIRNKLGIQD